VDAPPDLREWTDAMTALLAQNWWAIALRGALAIVFGVIALFLPGPTIAALVLLFAAYMLVDGAFAIVAGVRAARRHERWGMLVLEAIIDFAAAAIALFAPIATVIGVVWLMAAWAIVSGVVLTAAMFRLQVAHGRWLMGLSGVLSVICGGLLLIWPAAGAVVLTWWMGAYALVFGIALLALAFKLRRRRDKVAPGVASQRA
jgi:uncharacterized membrane protein HdeD (DUF308 family)